MTVLAQPTTIRVAGDYTKMNAPAIARCRSCRAAIQWFTTAQRKPMPVDASPRFLIDSTTVEDGRPLTVISAVPHWVTCPQRDDWRTR